METTNRQKQLKIEPDKISTDVKRFQLLLERMDITASERLRKKIETLMNTKAVA